MRDDNDSANEFVVLGAGLAGLTAADHLTRAQRQLVVIERDATVGGLAKTVDYRGFKFDLGGHRFITDDQQIEQMVRRLMDNELLHVNRSSKILLGGKYFDYPLKPLNAFFGLGVGTALRILCDYAAQQGKRMFPYSETTSLEEWVVRHYGRTLYRVFFKQYSEKIWGLDGKRIGSEWVAQRIQGMSLAMAIKNALLRTHYKSVRTLAQRFLYPPMGIGQIATRLQRGIERNNRVLTDSRVTRIRHHNNTIQSVIVRRAERDQEIRAKTFISSIPLTVLVQLLSPRPPLAVLRAASNLKYRDLVIVTLLLARERVSDQTWIYVPAPDIPFARIHEPTNWSPLMAPPGKTLLVTEHFCFRGDGTWQASDRTLSEDTVKHLVALGMIQSHEVIDSVVIRVANAYPVFEVGYRQHCDELCAYLDNYSNLILTGRGGRFQYYNMDHTMACGLRAAQQALADQDALLPTELPGLASSGVQT